MYEQKTICNLDDYFKDFHARSGNGVYFYRINGYDEAVRAFISKYYEAARNSGVIIEGKIHNPDEKRLAYYDEMMGTGFQLSMGFLTSSLRKWLPRLSESQCSNLAMAIYDTLDAMRRNGKNENILRNACIKFMCWLYYQFEQIISRLGEEKIPKILYEGDIGVYELKFITILSKAGCDAVLLQYKGDEGYLKLDPQSKWSYAYIAPGLQAFPDYFNIKWLRQEMNKEWQMQSLYGTLPRISGCTNTWFVDADLENIRKSPPLRGNEQDTFYHAFCRINGVEDKSTYLNELYQFQMQLKSSKRKLVVTEHGIKAPSADEINSIHRKNYETREQMIVGLSHNIQFSGDAELEHLMVKAFVDIMLEEGQNPDNNLNKLTNRGVYLLCWLRRYQLSLFSNWKMPDVSCFIYFGGCNNSNEILFLKFIAGLPIDVLILCPDLNETCRFTDEKLWEHSFQETLPVKQFPTENTNIQIGTAAYHAERELDEIMYQDSGMYRNHQYNEAVTISLQTMYEEIALLWNEELKYRPNFSIVNNIANLPVIFAKVSGVKDGLISEYWSKIKQLVTADTFVVKQVPFIKTTDANPVKAFAAEFFKQGRLQKQKIKMHQIYQYGHLREEMQEHLLDKLQLLIDQKLIAGTFENGMEYNIIATVLNLDKELTRMIQSFDFTRNNPKLIYINASESMISPEDSILTAFLNLVGFDIVFFVPTGYRSVEKYFNKKIIEEHQIGEYLFDMPIPAFNTVNKTQNSPFHMWREKIFRRGD